MRTQAEDDVRKARLLARNCLLLEKRRGRAELNVGTASERRMVPRAEAWQRAYALETLIDLGADHARLAATARKRRQEAAATAGQPRSGSPPSCPGPPACASKRQMIEDAVSARGRP